MQRGRACGTSTAARRIWRAAARVRLPRTLRKVAISNDSAGAAKPSYGLSLVSLLQMSTGTEFAGVEAVHCGRSLIVR